MECLSERITNISDLESILIQLRVKAQIAKKSTCISDIQALILDIDNLSDQAMNFEFKIEKRKIILSE